MRDLIVGAMQLNRLETACNLLTRERRGFTEKLTNEPVGWLATNPGFSQEA
jgi:hypothetical protein